MAVQPPLVSTGIIDFERKLKSFPPLLNLLLVIYYYFGLDVEFQVFIKLSLMFHDPDVFIYLGTCYFDLDV